MPRIDPQQLLTCLSVLLSPNGGILSKDVVQRLANLMTKFSKKLVSKCVYVLILKNTEQHLLDSFMAEGGWSLLFTWIQDAFHNRNWALVNELLQLLLITPVDVERLKSNSLPKLVKSLSKREDLEGVHQLASQLVQQWLKIVKDETQSEIATQNQIQTLNQVEVVPTFVSVVAAPPTVAIPTEPVQIVEISPSEDNTEIVHVESPEKTVSSSCYKLAVRDGKHVLCKVPANEANVSVVENTVIEEVKAEETKESKKEEKSKENKEKSSRDKEKKRSSDSSRSKSSSKDRGRSSSSSSSKSREKDRKSSSSSSRSKDRKDHEKDKHRSNGSLKHSSSKSSSSSSSSSSKDKKETKEKQAEKDKDTLAKLQPQSLNKLGRIPRKSSDEKIKEDDKKKQEKKASMGIEVKNPNEPRPKTVKVYNSKMRSTGLLEEAKPPPPRNAKKATAPPTIPPNLPVKRSSPIRELIPPPEKKTKLEIPERPGAIKLIPPKPKPSVLLESDIFMDALNASATTKKEPKKRKRRPSASKEPSGSSPPSSPAAVPSSPTGSTLNFKNITPANFYQDTLNGKTDDERSEDKNEDDSAMEEDDHSIPPTRTDVNGLKGVLLHTKKKGPKRSITWKQDNELVDVQYFELDETERVNVTRAFMDLAKMEMTGEREALQLSRKLPNEDVMDVQLSWRNLIEVEMKAPLAQFGVKSLEKDIQFAREKSVLQALYFNRKMIPDSPIEPEPETHQMTDPVLIPLEDPDNPEQDTAIPPWPEAKGSPPPPSIQTVPPIFTNPFPNFPIPTQPATFPNIPFTGPGNTFIPPNMMGPNMNNGPMIPPNMPPPEMMNSGPMPPGPFGPGPGPEFNQNMNDFPPHFNQPPGMGGMFPPNNFNMNRGRGFRRGGGMNGPWIRMNGPGPGWNPGRGGGGNRGGRVCKNVKNHGYCRNRDSCPFYHPN